MKRILIIAAALTASGVTSLAQADGLGLAGKVSTNGYGIELGYRFNDYLAVRGGINRGSYDYSETDAGINYQYTLDFDNNPVLLDWHPLGGVFRLTAGVVNNNNQLTGRASGSVDVGGTLYNTTVTTDITFKKTSPYVGLGWGGLPAKKGGLGFSFDIGVMMHGSPTAKITAPGVPEPNRAAEEAALNADLKDFKYWPVVSFGIGYTF
jgi:hypothetical protein